MRRSLPYSCPVRRALRRPPPCRCVAPLRRRPLRRPLRRPRRRPRRPARGQSVMRQAAFALLATVRNSNTCIPNEAKRLFPRRHAILTGLLTVHVTRTTCLDAVDVIAGWQPLRRWAKPTAERTARTLDRKAIDAGVVREDSRDDVGDVGQLDEALKDGEADEVGDEGDPQGS